MIPVLCGPLVVLVFVVSASLLFPPRLAVRNTPIAPSTPHRYANVQLPAHFTQGRRNHDNTPPDNPLTDEGATLGRMLFYDTRLSANRSTSCASCHVQAHAFANPAPASRGLHGARTDRRAMPLVNLRHYKRGRFFWDERTANLEEAVLLPIQSRIEMGQDLERLVDILARDETYPVLFTRAFGDRRINEQRIGKALAQFVRSIVSFQSRYDDGRARARSAWDSFENFTRQENRGKALFMRNCSSCHMKDGNEHFFVPGPANTGLRAGDPAADGGVADATLRAADLGSFKSPSLRNVAVTAPYGHDGRFATLGALIDHYSDHPIVDPNVGYARPVGPLKFTGSEKAALIAFLETLTDRALLSDPKFSNPFVQRIDAVRNGARALLTSGAVLSGMAAATIRAPALLRSAVLVTETPFLPLAPGQPGAMPSDVVGQRLMSFDANGDDRIRRDELPERMQALAARGDRNTDGALDVKEIESLVSTAPFARDRVDLRAEQFEGLPGVITDLKLAPAAHSAAVAILTGFPPGQTVDRRTGRDLYEELRALLDVEDYQNFVAAAARLPRRSHVID